MDPEILSALGVKFEWVGDRIATRADVKPRHIGRPITAGYVEQTDFTGPVPKVGEYRDAVNITGTLEAVLVNDFVISGDIFPINSLQNVRVWRRAVVRPDERSAR